jgi:polyhydroxyalkanoate synthesis repressor PhaR
MPVLIKRYANRKLYNTESSRYITLKGISELIRDGKEIRVIDNESGDEITPIILSQILVDDQRQQRDSPDRDAVPGKVLSELIQRGGDALYGMLRRSVDDAQDNISDFRDNVRRWIHVPDGESRETLEISRAVHQAVERVFRLIDLPTRSDVESLNKNLDRLASALENFEKRIRNLEGHEEESDPD